MPNSPSKSLIVTLSGDRTLDEVAQQLAESGLHVQHKLSTTGVIAGFAPKGSVRKLQAIRGVAAVHELGPPQTPISGANTRLATPQIVPAMAAREDLGPPQTPISG